MDSKREARMYFNKFFKEKYFNEDDYEFKSLARLLNKVHKHGENRFHKEALKDSIIDFNNELVKYKDRLPDELKVQWNYLVELAMQ